MNNQVSLTTARETMKVLRVSREFLYRLPKGTPGVYRFGRALRFNIEQLQSWARKQAAGQEY